jgi:hypothetical protein
MQFMPPKTNNPSMAPGHVSQSITDMFVTCSQFGVPLFMISIYFHGYSVTCTLLDIRCTVLFWSWLPNSDVLIFLLARIFFPGVNHMDGFISTTLEYDNDPPITALCHFSSSSSNCWAGDIHGWPQRNKWCASCALQSKHALKELLRKLPW